MKKLLLTALLGLSPTAAAQTFTLNTSAYSSTPDQTSGNPFITATGARVRPGTLAVSRDMLARHSLPYGTRVKAVSQRGCGVSVVGRVFTVSDTMHRRYARSADIWFPTRAQALKFGRCSVTFQKLN